MLTLKVLVFTSLIVSLFTSQSLTMFCGECLPSTTLTCITEASKCYKFNGTNLAFQICSQNPVCDLIGTTLSLDICPVDFSGLFCPTKVCLFQNPITLYTSLDECVQVTDKIAVQCTQVANCQKPCTNCLRSSSTQPSFRPVTSCMDDFQTTCFSLTTTISTTKTDCGLDSFGKTSDCCTTYKFSNFSRAGICTEKVEHFSRLNTTTKMVLAKWVFDSLTILSAFVIIVNLMI